ncbi:MAG: hypothetical protein LBD99_02855 [Candidatus Margulisbacteria bacterium]|nr:hypothetical protein [Candidatus Margulisiibacteriota bacterium]
MKKKITIILSIMTALAIFLLSGCGTTLSDSLGDPPLEAEKELSGSPTTSHLRLVDNVDYLEVIGAAGCVESGAKVIVSDVSDGRELSIVTATAEGNFKAIVPKENLEGVMVQAQEPDKAASIPAYCYLILP